MGFALALIVVDGLAAVVGNLLQNLTLVIVNAGYKVLEEYL